MDPFYRRISSVLKENKPMDFAPACEGSRLFTQHFAVASDQPGASRHDCQTKILKKGPEGPVFIYTLPPGIKQRLDLTLTDPSVTIVSVTFQKLKHLCRFEKGVYCKNTRRDCATQNCPQLLKGK